MSSNMLTSAATTAALPTSSTSTKQRFSQTSTAVATPRAQSPGATTIGTDNNVDLADFDYEVFQTRDSLEIARANFAFHAEQRQAGLAELFPFGRNSLELARRNIERAQLRRQRKVGDAVAFAFSRLIGSRFYEDRSALTEATANPIWDYQLKHRDSLELPREKAAAAIAAVRRNAQKPAQRLIARANAFRGSVKAALSGLTCECFQSNADLSAGNFESAVGLLD